LEKIYLKVKQTSCYLLEIFHENNYLRHLVKFFGKETKWTNRTGLGALKNAKKNKKKSKFYLHSTLITQYHEILFTTFGPLRPVVLHMQHVSAFSKFSILIYF